MQLAHPYGLRFIEPGAPIAQHFLAPWRDLKQVAVPFDVAPNYQVQDLALLFLVKGRCLTNIA